MAAAAILNCYFVTVDHPRSLLHGPKFVFNCIITFRDMAICQTLPPVGVSTTRPLRKPQSKGVVNSLNSDDEVHVPSGYDFA